MPIFLRFLIGIPLAAVVAILLFLLMRALIAMGELPINEEREATQIQINQEVEELQVRERDMTPDQVEQVDPPPPPPSIEKQVATQPTEAITNIGGQIPEFEQPDISRNDMNFTVSDRDAQPLVRVAVTYPPRAAERGTEGSCRMTFDVNPQGAPYNIRANCTDSVFERTSIRTVEQWKYAPKVVDGQPVARSGVQTTLTYQLES